MKKLSEMSLLTQLGIFLGIAVVIVIAGEYAYLNGIRTANAESRKKLEELQKENDAVRPIENRLKQIKVENEQLEKQLANLRMVVPEEKEADSFIRMVQQAGVNAGVDIRRFTARPPVVKEFHSELPFELEIDGNYSGVLQFFDKLGKLPRIVNISNLSMGPITANVKGVRKKYTYGPSETVLASCTATTFFSREAPVTTAPARR